MHKFAPLFVFLIGLAFASVASAQGVVWEMLPSQTMDSTQEYPYGPVAPNTTCITISYTVISMADEFEPYIQVGSDRFAFELAEVTPEPGFYTQELRLTDFALKDPVTGELDLAQLYDPSDGINGAGIHGWDEDRDAHIVVHGFTPGESCGMTDELPTGVTAIEWQVINSGTPRDVGGEQYVDFPTTIDLDLRGLRLVVIMFDDDNEWLIDATVDSDYTDFVRIRLLDGDELPVNWADHGWTLMFMPR